MGTPVRLLVVENIKDDADLILHELRRSGFDPQHQIVATQSTFTNALERGPWDLVLSDYDLGSFTGLDALRLLQTSGLDIPFILVSGTPGEEQAVESVKLGAEDYLLKGNLRRLGPAVQRALQATKARRSTREAESVAQAERNRLFDELRRERKLLADEVDTRTRQLMETNAKLIESERRFQAMVNNLPGVVSQIRMRPDGNFYYGYLGGRLLDRLGIDGVAALTSPALVGSRRLPQEDVEREKILRHSLQTMEPYGREFQMRAADGTLKWLRSSGTPYRDPNGDAVWDSIVIDITDARRKEDELRASKELMTLITQNVPGVVFRRESKPDGSLNFVYYTGRLLEAFQVTGLDALENPARVLELVHPEDRAALLQLMSPAHEDLQPHTYLARVMTPEGTWRWIEMQSRAEQHPDGRIFRNGMMVDVTPLKEAEAALAESERRFRAVVNNAPVMVFQQRLTQDGKLEFTFFSDRMHTIMGIAPSEALANPSQIERLFHPDDLELRKRSLQESVDNMSLRDLDVRFLHPDGTYHWLQMRAVPRREPNGDIVWDGISHDITDRRKLEESLRHTERLQAMAQLTEGIAHHFNNLLAIVSGYVELLCLDASPDSERNDLLTQIQLAVARGTRLVTELQEFSKYEPGPSGVVPVRTLLQHLHSLATPVMGSDIELILEATPDLWGATVDGSRLQTAVLNLLFNARDALPDGGRVVIAARNLSEGDGPAGAAQLSPGAYVEISVKDNGVGMTSEILERSINPFFTTKAVGQGVGLGLSMVHRFATQSGGMVSLHSTPRSGTEVRMLLPASPDAVLAA